MADKYYVPFSKKIGQSETRYKNNILYGFDKQLKSTSEWLGTTEARDFFRQEKIDLHNFLKESELYKNLDKIIQSNASSSEQYVETFYKQGSKKGHKDIKRTLKFTKADEKALYYLKNYNFKLIRNVNNDLRYGLRRSLTRAVIEGKSIGELRKEILELPLTPIRNFSPHTRARMIARTEYSRARNTGNLQAYANYGVETVEIITANDNFVCDLCLDIEEHNPYSITDSNNLPPFHTNCRCTVAPVTALSSYQNAPLENPNIVNLIP